MFGQCGTFVCFPNCILVLKRNISFSETEYTLFATIITRACFKTHMQIIIFFISRLSIMVKLSLTLKIVHNVCTFFHLSVLVFEVDPIVYRLFDDVKHLMFTYLDIYILSSMLY